MIVSAIAACATPPRGPESDIPPSFGGDNDAGSSGPEGLGPDQDACASAFSESNVSPVNLVFMYDESSSMTQPTGLGASKWDAAKSGVTSFVSDPASAGLSAVIEFFSGPPIGQTGPLCETGTYSTAAAGPVALPDDGGVIARAIASRSPNGSTATYYAMLGARQIASTVLARKPGEKAAIIFVTDGIPEGCSFDNSIGETAKVAAASSSAGVPIYVIGVGNSLTSLDAIAKSGGTSAAYIVDTNGDVSTALLSALGTIRGRVASCSLPIPDAPAGETIDHNAVNVGYGGQTLTYSKDCSKGAGWHYDNASAPHTIELCPTSCSEVKTTARARVSVAFGCATKGGVVR